MIWWTAVQGNTLSDLTLKKKLAQRGLPKSRFNHITIQKRKCALCIIVLSHFLIFLSNILKDTPLTEAAMNGHVFIVKLLIENGADVNKGGLVR